MNGAPWTDIEIARLLAFDGQPWSGKALMEHFPGRTYAAIERKAGKLGVKLGANTRPPKKHEPHTSFSVTLSLEHHRKFKAIMNSLGFKTPSFMRWMIDSMYEEADAERPEDMVSNRANEGDANETRDGLD